MKINRQTVAKKGKKTSGIIQPFISSDVTGKQSMDLSEHAKFRNNLFKRTDSCTYTRLISAQPFS